jgi:hypothetical protein
MIATLLSLAQDLPTQPQPLQELPTHQKVTAVVLAVVMLAVVIELVRKRKLREEYSFVWIGTALLLLALALQPRLLNLVQGMIGAVMGTSALFFGCMVFLMLLCLQFSVRLSRLTYRHRQLVQQMALLHLELEQIRDRLRQREQETVPAQPRDGAA